MRRIAISLSLHRFVVLLVNDVISNPHLKFSAGAGGWGRIRRRGEVSRDSGASIDWGGSDA